ncbi:MAG: hypothetical protein GXO43_03335 [Crenarchaeota archaeon]|nr:hypothetical protein [Thermoproteota archaeon]
MQVTIIDIPDRTFPIIIITLEEDKYIIINADKIKKTTTEEVAKIIGETIIQVAKTVYKYEAKQKTIQAYINIVEL